MAEQKLGQKLWQQIEHPQGYAYIADAVEEMADEQVIEIAHNALVHARQVIEELERFLREAGEETESDEQLWLVIAGTQPSIVVKQELNTPDAIKASARIYASIHNAAIWAAPLSGMPTGILAWPKWGKVQD